MTTEPRAMEVPPTKPKNGGDNVKEYEKRIQEHKSRLPHIREKIAASAVFFIVGILMLSTVTFSWLTLSVAPEASNITMSIATNGSLEVALAHEILRDESGKPILDENGNAIPLAPDQSQVGDSLKELALRNITWGNLVNLSDPSYALDKIVLRPATLNTGSLLSQPLYAATYDKDGRISSLRSDFAYTQWSNSLNNFTASDYKGVKAISSVKFDEVEYTNPLLGTYATKIENIEKLLENARFEFNGLSSSANISAIDGIMTTYMNGTLRQKVNEEPCSVEDIGKFYDMMVEVYDGPVQTIGEAYMGIIELYQLDTYGQNNSTDLNYERFTDLDAFCSGITAYIAQMNADRVAAGDAEIKVSTDFPNLNQYLSDRANLKKYIDELENYKGASDTTWGDIKHIVNFVVDIDTCEINGKTVSTLTGSLSKYASELLGMIGSGKANQNNAVVKKGLMQRLDKMLHNGIDTFKINKVSIVIEKAALKTRIQNSSMSSLAGMVDWVISGETGIAEANIKTNAKDEAAIGTTRTDVNNAFEIVGAESVTKTFVAQDTYGLSIDFWVRTNASASFLVLEGEVKYDYIDIKQNITVTAADGSSTTHDNVQIYLADVVTTTTVGNSTETATAEDQEVYELDGVWYFVAGNEAVSKTESGTVQDENGQDVEASLVREITGTPSKKQDKVVSGYSGANRIWTEEELKDMSEMEYRTTQGTGSCYTFYADPAEAEQIMRILSALKIAFVDIEGNYIGGARLATELCFSEYGKHTVPIVLDENSLTTGLMDENGEEIRAITQLEKNEATLITALIYLDGTMVSNETVLSSSDIEGRFNIQFGSTEILESIENEELMGSELVVSGSVTNESGNENPTADYYLGMEEDGYKTTVTLTVTGDAPSSVYGYFLRKISNTQGTRQEKITFTQSTTSPEQWIAEMSFYSPGIYILRSVIVDGIEHELQYAEGSTPPTVTINGFSCTNFHGTSAQSYTYRTASSFVNESFYVSISAKDDGLVPKSVEGIFIGDNGKTVSISFSDADRDTVYEGLANFQASGTYTCKYLIIDGEYYELPVEYTREIYTGLEVAVWISQMTDDNAFIAEEELNRTESGFRYIYKGITHSFNIQMRIYDSEGDPIEGLNNINIFYSQDMDAQLTWNASTRYYTGQLPPVDQPGTFKFVNVTAGNESIDRARSAMSITAIPSDPVSYNGIDGAIASQVIRISGASTLDEQARVSLKFTNAQSAEVFGKFTKTNENGTQGVILKATKSTTNGNIYVFNIPDEDGIWQLTEVKLSFVYDGETQTFFMGDESLETLFGDGTVSVPVMSDGDTPIDRWETAADYYVVEADDDWGATKIIKSLHSVTQATGSYYTGHGFMESYALTDKVTFNDVFGGEISNMVENVTLAYKFSKTDTKVDWTGSNSVSDIVIALIANDTNTEFTMPADSTLHLPGTYNVTLNYDIVLSDSETISVSNALTQFTLSYVMPTVEITGITPEGTYSFDKSSSPRDPSEQEGCDDVYSTHSDHNSAFTSSFDSYNATVYFKCLHPGGTKYGTDRQDHYYTTETVQSDGTYGNPSVTITLSGMGDTFTSATLNFSDNSNICSNTTYSKGTLWGYNVSTSGSNSPYKWTTNSSVTRYIGQVKTDTTLGGGFSKTPAGKITAETLSVVVDGETYTVKIPTITIDNSY